MEDPTSRLSTVPRVARSLRCLPPRRRDCCGSRPTSAGARNLAHSPTRSSPLDWSGRRPGTPSRPGELDRQLPPGDTTAHEVQKASCRCNPRLRRPQPAKRGNAPAIVAVGRSVLMIITLDTSTLRPRDAITFVDWRLQVTPPPSADRTDHLLCGLLPDGCPCIHRLS